MPPGAPARIYETRKYPFKGIDIVYIELEYATGLTEVSPVQPVQSNAVQRQTSDFFLQNCIAY